MNLSITNLEAERQRRLQVQQIAQIERLARSGGELPKLEIYVGGRFTDINFGVFKIKLEWTELEGDRRHLNVVVANQEVEEKLLALFPDPAVTKKLYEHIFKALGEELAKDGTTLERYGDTKFCG